MATTLTLPEAARRYGGLTTIAARAVPDPDFADISVTPLPAGATLVIGLPLAARRRRHVRAGAE